MVKIARKSQQLQILVLKYYVKKRKYSNTVRCGLRR
jgi:hypothetical protein